MLNFNDLIVYLWLMPVGLQILLPLIVLGCWLLSRIPMSMMKKSEVDDVSTARASTA